MTFDIKHELPSIEVMAPVGSYESLMAAIQAGADSIYFGIEQLNMRARAADKFSVNDLNMICRTTSAHGIKTYITLNTILYDHDLVLMKKIIATAKEVGVNAIIASDQAAINYAYAMGMPVHISTQLNITNIETIKFYAPFADVMVLSRELNLNQITKIVEAIRKEHITGPAGKLIQIEAFAHGALCMAVSGKCYLSLHTQNSSANRGACKQNCRRPYTVKDIDGNELVIDNEYIMSPKDLCTIDFLDKMIEAGISVLKIEGRGRSADYVYETVACYKEATQSYLKGNYNIIAAEVWKKRLENVYNRGFWDGYYLGKKLGEWTNSDGSKALQRKEYIGRGTHYYPKAKVAEFKIETGDLRTGEEVLITGPATGIIRTKVEEIHIDGQLTDKVFQGQLFTTRLTSPIRKSDKLYKIIERK